MTLKSILITALELGVASVSVTSYAGEVSDRVEETKTLLVGTEGTYAPFTFHNKQGELTGFDIDVVKAVADKLGLKVEFKETQWDAMYAGLNAKRFDVIANQTTPTPERLKKYDYSEPYNYSSAVVVVKKDDDSIKQFSDLKDKKAAQSLTSNFTKIAQENAAHIVPVDGLAQALELIRQKRAQATVNDKLAVLDYFQKIPHSGLVIAFEDKAQLGTAFAFTKGEQPLIDKVNQALAQLRTEGTLKQISIKWFGDDITQ
ncbi:amino acid ABC transporter substrate-binding protein [Pasteurellaceae bacterium HPA106]|uniref:amino acid ABC transporter substrate-binding protein n=1 Tax=Spirabiliibacterium pneumoniae TaxID=221400 RepID=UPI001AAD0C8F|nr:amino acid ABC transporter substrate-binding protein [Spirabiliibacterium pneumoniae]MBE2896319.1 amino acid ABC transporter substrate-binding protein [Spirabiliibacterium pneumoniae]